MTKNRLKDFAVFSWFIILIVSTPFDGIKLCTAAAQYFTGPQSRALGSTGRATLSGAESPFLNPAMLAHVKTFHLAGFTNLGQISNIYTLKELGVVFIDNNPEAVLPASFSYVQRTHIIDGISFNEEMYQVAFGRLIADGLSMGIGANYFRDLAVVDQIKTNWNGNFGLLFTPARNIGIGVVKYNLLKERATKLKSAYGFGFQYLVEEILRLRTDLVYQDVDNPEQKWTVMAGVESILRGDITFRFGYKNDSMARSEYAACGFGWNGPKIGLDYAYEKNIRKDLEFTHSIDLRVFF